MNLTSFYRRYIILGNVLVHCSYYPNPITTNIFKYLKLPKKLSQKRKFPRHGPKNQKPPVSQVHACLDIILQRAASSAVKTVLVYCPLLSVKLWISFKCLKLFKKLSQKRKFPRHLPKNKRSQQFQVFFIVLYSFKKVTNPLECERIRASFWPIPEKRPWTSHIHIWHSADCAICFPGCMPTQCTKEIILSLLGILLVHWSH